MTFDEILPYLASAYRRGVLVPFIGSGMSRPACTDWETFLHRLVEEAGVESEEKKGAASGSLDLYRLADRAVRGLSSMPGAKRASAYRRALQAGPRRAGGCDIPPQTQALARRHWPLVLSTNYDDLYVVSRLRQSTQGRGGDTDGGGLPEVLGRSVEDCHKVVRSLDAPTRPILWALQGFVGGQGTAPKELISAEHRRLELASQVVAGHQQYQNVINAQPHFRRAFAEVLHRRSLLFLGSGILEDYLVNLFGEIAHHYGPGPHPHFALFSDDKRPSLDASFLQTRLGIIPVFYSPADHHAELPRLLNRFADSISGEGLSSRPSVPSPVAWMPDELGFCLTNGSRPPFGSSRRFKLRYSTLSVPDGRDSECVVVSVGRGKRNQTLQGTQATTLLADAVQARLIPDAKRRHWHALDAKPSYVYRFGDAPIFGVAARVRHPADDGVDEGAPDRRDLGVISDAVYAALCEVDRAGFRRVHLGPVASGRYRLWHPIHPFVQTLLGVRRFFAEHPDTAIEVLDLHVMAPAVWSPVLAGRIPVGDILSSDVMKVWVDIRDPDGTSEIFAVIVRGPTPVADIKRLCGLDPKRWNTEVLPRPRKSAPEARDEDSLLVAPTSMVVFSPRV